MNIFGGTDFFIAGFATVLNLVELVVFHFHTVVK